MKQLNLFEDCVFSVTKQTKKGLHWKLFVDGASRKNPGKAGAGIYLVKEDKAILKKGFFLGIKTNNQAEYLALILGIFYAKKYMNKNDTLAVFSDSELLVKHMKREYKVKSNELKQLFDVAQAMLSDISYNFCHIFRDQNTVADALANEGIDKKVTVPQEFIKVILSYDLYS